MTVTIKVNGTSNSLAHKGCNGFAKCTLPDVCKTPSPGGPVPIPYPVIVSRSGDLAKGTKTVKVDGGNMAAVKGSEYSRCMGDEPGTAGGVKSSTNMKEATWLLYSFDVKLEGKNACRLGDKMQMNHGNTVCLQGEVHAPVVGVPDVERMAKCAIKECDKKKLSKKEMDQMKAASANPKDTACKALGRIKHKCVEEKMKKVPGVDTEASFNTDVSPPTKFMSRSNPSQNASFWSAWAQMKSYLKSFAPPKSYQKGMLRRPDISWGDHPDRKIVDAKFPCPGRVEKGDFGKARTFPSGPKTGARMMSDEQKQAYKKIAGNGKNVKALSPADCKGTKCTDTPW